jgi:hypothetical protein
MQREETLARYRARLLGESASQRRRIAGGMQGLDEDVGSAERAWKAGRWVYEHRVLIGVGVSAALLFRGPRRFVAQASRLFALWRSARALLR